jgi:hypothetical protein
MKTPALINILSTKIVHICLYYIIGNLLQFCEQKQKSKSDASHDKYLTKRGPQMSCWQIIWRFHTTHLELQGVETGGLLESKPCSWEARCCGRAGRRSAVTLPAAAKGNNEPISYESSTSIEMHEASSAQQKNSQWYGTTSRHALGESPITHG